MSSTGNIRFINDKDDAIVLPVTHERGVVDSNGVNLETKLGQKQATLVSGSNIKTINNNSLLGSGNLTIQSGAADGITSEQDGTVDISLSNGDTVTIDLNHDHPQYLKYVYLEDEREMPVTPEATTLYLIKETAEEEEE